MRAVCLLGDATVRAVAALHVYIKGAGTRPLSGAFVVERIGSRLFGIEFFWRRATHVAMVGLALDLRLG